MDSASLPDPKSVCVLVVDDNPDDRESYIRWLKKVEDVNYRCREATGGSEGLRMIEEVKPDCVLLDYSLPGHNGLEVLKQIRKQHAFLPVILLTGQGNEAIAVQAIKEGADDYFVKATASNGALHISIKEAVSHSIFRRELAEKDRQIKEKADALAASEQLYRLLVEGLHDHVICWLDPKGKIKSWNSGGARITKYAAEEAVGQNFSILYPDLDRESGTPYLTLEQVAARGTYAGEIRLVRKGGAAFWAHVFIDALRDAGGNLIGFVIMIQDATERRENRKRDEMFRLMVDGVVDYAIYMLDIKGCVQSWNNGAERIKKYREEEIIGRHFSVFYPEEERYTGKPMEALARAAAGGKYTGEGWWVRKSGERFWANIVIDALRDQQGNLLGFSNVVRDITERRKMEAALRYAEKRNELAVRSLSIGLWDWNVVTDDVYWSARASDILGVTDRTFTARLSDFTERLHPADRSAVMQKIDRHLQFKEPYDVEYRLRRNDGAYVWIHACGQAEWNERGDPVRMVGAVEDISERKAVIRMKDEFVAMVSHELRTPLTSIHGALGLMNGRILGELPPKCVELIKIAYKNSERLSLLINDILDVEKIESGNLQMDIKPVELAPFLKQVLEATQPFGDKFKATFILKGTPEGACVLADAGRLTQVLTNLLSNAAKFSPQGGEVHIKVERRDSMLRFSVRDFGSGIPLEFRPRIFQKFSQADSSDTRRCEGTGLGLSIARKLVGFMHGTLDFESEVASGTTFFFDLPDAAQGSARATPAKEQHDGTGA